MSSKENKKVVDFYLKGNELKRDIISDDGRTIAQHLYSSMILALAINKEFDASEDISKVIRMIMFDGIALTDDDFHCSDYLKNGLKYDKEIEEKNKMTTFDSIFAMKCRILDLKLHDLIINNKDKCQYEIYKLAIKNGIITPRTLEENKKYQEIFRFYYENSKLENKVRSGWDDNHWAVNGKRESVADHVYGTMVLALSMEDKFEEKVDIDKVLQTLLIHEIGEIKIGDLTPFDNVTREEKQKIEHAAMKDVLGNLNGNDELFKMLLDFDDEKTSVSKFSHLCYKLEADLQSKVYEDRNEHRNLDDQENNVVFKNKKIQKMLAQASTAFDIWYLWDKDIYKNSRSFSSILEYIKSNKIAFEKEYQLVYKTNKQSQI